MEIERSLNSSFMILFSNINLNTSLSNQIKSNLQITKKKMFQPIQNKEINPTEDKTLSL